MLNENSDVLPMASVAVAVMNSPEATFAVNVALKPAKLLSVLVVLDPEVAFALTVSGRIRDRVGIEIDSERRAKSTVEPTADGDVGRRY